MNELDKYFSLNKTLKCISGYVAILKPLKFNFMCRGELFYHPCNMFRGTL